MSPVAMKILCMCKGYDLIHLITDNTNWAGLPNGEYEWSEGRVVVKEENKVYVKGGTLAGSVASMNFDVSNMIREVGCSLQQAVRMATINSAKVIGVQDRKGTITPGKDADLVIIDDNIQVYFTMVKGEIVYRKI